MTRPDLDPQKCFAHILTNMWQGELWDSQNNDNNTDHPTHPPKMLSNIQGIKPNTYMPAPTCPRPNIQRNSRGTSKQTQEVHQKLDRKHHKLHLKQTQNSSTTEQTQHPRYMNLFGH